MNDSDRVLQKQNCFSLSSLYCNTSQSSCAARGFLRRGELHEPHPSDGDSRSSSLRDLVAASPRCVLSRQESAHEKKTPRDKDRKEAAILCVLCVLSRLSGTLKRTLGDHFFLNADGGRECITGRSLAVSGSRRLQSKARLPDPERNSMTNDTTAIETLCCTQWHVFHGFIQRRGYDCHQAEDQQGRALVRVRGRWPEF